MKSFLGVLFFFFPLVSSHFSSLYSKSQNFDARFYISDGPKFDPKNSFLLFEEKNILYSQPEGEEYIVKTEELIFNFTQRMQNNGTIYGHLIIMKAGLQRDQPLIITQRLNMYLPRSTVKNRRNLLFDPPFVHNSSESGTIVSFWQQKIHLHIVADLAVYTNSNQFSQNYPISSHFLKADQYTFSPILYINTDNVVDQVYIPINSTLDSVPLEVTFSILTIDRFEWLKNLEGSFKLHQSLGTTNRELEDVKRMMLETNRVLLMVTSVVTFFHLLFDFLAFKNDISFWRNRKSFLGVSVWTVFINTISQAIILLYLFDNETSWLVLGPTTIGLLIEIWKIFQAGKVGLKFCWGFIPFPTFEEPPEYRDSLTREYDVKAVKYLGGILSPIVIGYSLYSLYFETHTGWYSWAINSLVAVVYTFGFVRMTPQLFINYKLKSVAHLPWRAFTYKALNTFIDDLFAFIIRMPTMHRLSCFRDDLVFLIYLYQRWIYPVDTKRVNEFGQTGEETKKKM